MTRLPSTCAAIRRARIAALEMARDADVAGHVGISRALRRKAMHPRPGDWQVVQAARHVEARISAYGVTARARRYTTEPAPDDNEAIDLIAQAAVSIVARESIA